MGQVFIMRNMGSYEEADLLRLLKEQVILPSDIMWKEGMADYQPVGNCLPAACPPNGGGAQEMDSVIASMRMTAEGTMIVMDANPQQVAFLKYHGIAYAEPLTAPQALRLLDEALLDMGRYSDRENWLSARYQEHPELFEPNGAKMNELVKVLETEAEGLRKEIATVGESDRTKLKKLKDQLRQIYTGPKVKAATLEAIEAKGKKGFLGKLGF